MPEPEMETRSPNYWVPASIVVAGIIVGVAVMLAGGGVGQTTATQAPAAGHAGTGTAAVTVDDDPAIGSLDAPVTMIEFSDFQCPFCRAFWRNAIEQIKRDYVDRGLVRFVYRDFPLTSIHASAQATAEAAECADNQGLFWPAHDAIFAGQDERGAGTIDYSIDDVYRWFARVPNLDVEAVRSCVASGEMRGEVEKDFVDGRSGGVTGTPGFFINGRAVSGALPYEAFQQVLDAAIQDAQR